MISFSGLASGIDTGSIISQLVQLERGTVSRLETKRFQKQSALSAFSTLSTKLEGLRTAMESMSDIGSFGKLSVTSSDEDKLTATSTGQASPGNFEINVNQLAQVQKTLSDSFADSEQTGLFGTGTLTITAGSDDPVDITVDGSTTLSSLKNSINESGADLYASIVNSDSGYRLVLSGKSSGDDEAITFTEGGSLSLGLDTPANTIQSAQDSKITLDGILEISRSTNTISDAIEGVTLDLKQVTDPGEPLAITIDRDSEAQSETIQEFIDSYNDVLSYIDLATQATEPGQRGPLLNNPTMVGIKRQLQRVLQSTVPTGSTYTSATLIGIETGQDGVLELDEEALNKALSADFDGALSIFTTNETGLADLFESAIDDIVDIEGMIPIQKSSLDRSISDLNDQIDRQNVRVDSYQASLQRQFLAMEQAISQLNNQSSFLQNQLLIS